jgi:hypothetical protein
VDRLATSEGGDRCNRSGSEYGATYYEHDGPPLCGSPAANAKAEPVPKKASLKASGFGIGFKPRVRQDYSSPISGIDRLRQIFLARRLEISV